MTKKVISWIASVTGALVVGLVVFWVATRPSTTASKTPPPAQTARGLTIEQKCPGRVIKVKVGTNPIDINPHACSFTPEVTSSGILILEGPDGSYKMWKGMPSFGNKEFHVVTTKAESGDVELKYVLCPPNRPAVGSWSCS